MANDMISPTPTMPAGERPQTQDPSLSVEAQATTAPSFAASQAEEPSLYISNKTRITVYDDFLSAPRVIDIDPAPVTDYIGNIAATVYSQSQETGGKIPYSVIREISENFIHAHFKEPVVSIFDHGNTISFTDQGPGISDKQKALLPGFTSATANMKNYIKGVGSGFPTVREYLSYSGGRLLIDDNINEGAVITISLVPEETKPDELVAVPMPSATEPLFVLKPEEESIFLLFANHPLLGQTDIKNQLGIPVASASRYLNSLEEHGLIEVKPGGKKRTLTTKGKQYLLDQYDMGAQ